MDLVGFKEEVYNQICKDYETILPYLSNFEDIQVHFVPICAINGDNITTKSTDMIWYKDKTLMEYLDTLPIFVQNNDDFIMCVQYVNRPHLNFRGFCGNIVSGSVKKGDEIVVLPSLKQSRVKEIVSTDIKHLRALTQDEKIEGVQESFCPNAITLTLEDEIDISLKVLMGT